MITVQDKKCPRCGKLFDKKRTKYCSLNCYADSMRNIEKPKSYKHVCLICSKDFFSNKKNKKFCSPICTNKSRLRVYKPLQKIECKKCGKEVYKRAGTQYCSLSCYRSFYRFGDLTPKTRFCAFCEKEFVNKVKKTKCCSPKCNLQLYQRNYKEQISKKNKETWKLKHPRLTYKKSCAICSKLFTSKNKRQIFCSSSCRVKSYRKQERVKLMRLLDVNKRNAEKHLTVGSFTASQWHSAQKYFNFRCAYCGKKVVKLQQDHFVPRKLKGDYVYKNIVPACPKCNQTKNGSHPEIWVKSKFSNGDEIYNKILNYFNSL